MAMLNGSAVQDRGFDVFLASSRLSPRASWLSSTIASMLTPILLDAAAWHSPAETGAYSLQGPCSRAQGCCRASQGLAASAEGVLLRPAGLLQSACCLPGGCF